MSNVQTNKPADGTARDGAGSEFLAFKLGAEEYGIDILKVQEIRGYEAVTRIANAPEFIKIILNIGGRIMGMVVDSVSDVTTLTPDQVKPAPEMGTAFNSEYMIGLGTVDERMLILVDIDKLMSSSEMGLMDKIAA